MSHHTMDGRKLDARPDRMDFRDLAYRPPLISLPSQFPSDAEVETFLKLYLASGSIRNQGTEGACTGFGLAACIDYITWDRMIRQRREIGQSTNTSDEETAQDIETEAADDTHFERASPFMLYDIAKMYDEWEGEDYSGSSCRGALKGWHKHGVCREALWRSPDDETKGPKEGWREDAAERPLGAYYRVDARSVSDLQAAIHEVRAVYCSARVHDGWLSDALNAQPTTPIGGKDVPIIGKRAPITGGHAFAMVGYTRDGFIIQNSWGTEWGFNGFALLTYEDWIENGNDAWVAALGAPISVSRGTTPNNRTSTPLSLTATMRSAHSDQVLGTDTLPAPEFWTSDAAYNHAIVLGNEGLPLRRRIDTHDAHANVDKVARAAPLEVAKADGAIKIMIYAHGGLNSEKAAIERAMRMGPWMRANGIYPIFVVWRTSLLDTLSNIKSDFVAEFLARREDLRAEGVGSIVDGAIAKLQNTFDKAFEVAAESTIGRPVWTQMKQNAGAAANGKGGTRLLFESLQDLRAILDEEGIEMEVHLVGHSAGAILLGHMLDDYSKDLPVNSATLLAPACTMAFANRHYGGAFRREALPKGGLRLHVLSDENERDDTVGPYGKSLLYLVSRALETPRKQPLLGLARCLNEGNAKLADIALGDGIGPRRAELNSIKDLLSAEYSPDDLQHVRDWRHVAEAHNVHTRIIHEREFITKVHRFADATGTVHEEAVKITATHGGFDNSLTVMNDIIYQILGDTPQPQVIDDLSGF